jgi:hypothetical protein
VATDLRTHTGCVVTALTLGGVTTYRGIGPANPYDIAPYVVVYAGSADTDGSAENPDADVWFEIQITAVGRTAEQAEWVADKARRVLIDGNIPPPANRAWMRRQRPALHVLTRPVERDDDAGPGSPMFYVASIYSLASSPT